ncbi:MAG: hypothetical protein KDA75_13440 [Planctomycetaceae bacterium]|nr:hypothetical protein [Planctomycetaceae bacterium]
MTAQEALRTHAFRVNDPHTATRVWDVHLTEEEREQLGDLETAYRQWKTVGIWMRAKRTTFELAIIELAKLFGLTDSDERWLRAAVGQPLPEVPVRPVWDRARGQLRIRDQVVREVRNLASNGQPTNIVRVLDAFEKEGWPPRIADPRPGLRDPERIRQTVRSLNSGLSRILFRADGTGEGIAWGWLDELSAESGATGRSR